jgi:hypothetical protein
VAYDGDRVTCTCRARREEAEDGPPASLRLTLPVAAILQRWLRHVPVPQTRVVRSYGLSHPTQADALAVCRTALRQPPVEVPVALDWQTVCAQRGALPPDRCSTCGQRLVCTGVGPRGGAPPSTSPGERAACALDCRGRPVRGVVRLRAALARDVLACCSAWGLCGGRPALSWVGGWG